ncbi:dihydrofolate reductase family protein [Dactylosporangium sp. AC04546]|uniref:dihydrofolate reductase family protein n=1 Tax=Dactylosporangium sp. AC04546 TaxID=2862460 RepID=UPI001EDC9639|nr:dihydrofolate reductase family protein [Dactylosporangium sp. AC04546]WVK80822.1 dihydrofolate reductase family protein [Dactylosporangium sp. AC04546]
MSVSLDGFSAGPDIDVERPMGEGGERLHEWLFKSDADRAVAAGGTSPTGVDAQVARELFAATGAVVVGRRTFDVGVDLWADTPFPVPCFVLTHESREPLVMKSAAFTFVTDGIERALQQARASAGDRDVLVMGGARTAQQFIRAGLVDEVQIQLVPVLLGAGTRLFDHLGTDHIELERTTLLASPYVTHLRFRVLK